MIDECFMDAIIAYGRACNATGRAIAKADEAWRTFGEGSDEWGRAKSAVVLAAGLSDSEQYRLYALHYTIAAGAPHG